jgi:O-antigen biosynthesis protein WbqP
MGQDRRSDIVKRAFDIALSAFALVILAPLMLVLASLVRLTSAGPALHWSKRVGRDDHIFLMPKFRTMRIAAPQLATHKMTRPELWLTPLGGFLRRTSLDELPQFWSVLVGDMSLVGPRPALFNQDDLVALRAEAGVNVLRPGMTGWAQINGRDELAIPDKVRLDQEYLRRRRLLFDLCIMIGTVVRVFRRQDVSH